MSGTLSDQKYYAFYDLRGYSASEREELKKKLTSAGFNYFEAEIGGGGEDYQALVLFKLGNFAYDVASNLLADYIIIVLSKLYNWYKKTKRSKKPGRKRLPGVLFYIAFFDEKGKKFIKVAKFIVNKPQTKHEIASYLDGLDMTGVVSQKDLGKLKD